MREDDLARIERSIDSAAAEEARENVRALIAEVRRLHVQASAYDDLLGVQRSMLRSKDTEIERLQRPSR